MENVHMLNMLIDNLAMQQMLEKPCLIVMHPLNYERLESRGLLVSFRQKGHLINPIETCELDAVYMARLDEVSTNEQA